MEGMQRKSDEFNSELKRLCKAGNRDAALQRAKQFGLEMANDPAMRHIKACTAGLQISQPGYEVPPEKLTMKDICTP
jgi:hypothetical protein